MPFLQRAQDPECEQEAAAAIVCDHVERRNGFAALRPDLVQQATQRQIIDVVAGTCGQRSVLTPARDSTVHQSWIADATNLRAETQALDDPRPVAFDQGRPRGRPVAARLRPQRCFSGRARDNAGCASSDRRQGQKRLLADAPARRLRPCRPASCRHRGQARCPRVRRPALPPAVHRALAEDWAAAGPVDSAAVLPAAGSCRSGTRICDVSVKADTAGTERASDQVNRHICWQQDNIPTGP